MEGLSSKEIEIVSYLELNERSFFTRKEILRFFKNENDLGVYLHRLKKKGRILKLTKIRKVLLVLPLNDLIIGSVDHFPTKDRMSHKRSFFILDKD